MVPDRSNYPWPRIPDLLFDATPNTIIQFVQNKTVLHERSYNAKIACCIHALVGPSLSIFNSLIIYKHSVFILSKPSSATYNAETACSVLYSCLWVRRASLNVLNDLSWLFPSSYSACPRIWKPIWNDGDYFSTYLLIYQYTASCMYPFLVCSYIMLQSCTQYSIYCVSCCPLQSCLPEPQVAGVQLRKMRAHDKSKSVMPCWASVLELNRGVSKSH
jgi:hypothetical protein